MKTAHNLFGSTYYFCFELLEKRSLSRAENTVLVTSAEKIFYQFFFEKILSVPRI